MQPATKLQTKEDEERKGDLATHTTWVSIWCIHEKEEEEEEGEDEEEEEEGGRHRDEGVWFKDKETRTGWQRGGGMDVRKDRQTWL